MKLKLSSALLAIMVVFSLTVSAFAYMPANEPLTETVVARMQQVIAEKSSSVSEEKDLKEYDKLVAIVDSANEKIENFVVTAVRSEKDDVEKLLEKVDMVVEQVIRKADAAGYDIECVYVPYEIDGQIVLIDPLRVVNSR